MKNNDLKNLNNNLNNNNDINRLRLSDSYILDLNKFEKIFNSLDKTIYKISLLSGFTSYITFHISNNINEIYKLDDEKTNEILNQINSARESQKENLNEEINKMIDADINFLLDLNSFYKNFDTITSLSDININTNLILLNDYSNNTLNSNKSFINDKMKEYISNLNINVLLPLNFIANSIVSNILYLRENNLFIFNRTIDFYNKINFDENVFNNELNELKEKENNKNETKPKKQNKRNKKSANQTNLTEQREEMQNLKLMKILTFLYYYGYILAMKNVKPLIII